MDPLPPTCPPLKPPPPPPRKKKKKKKKTTEFGFLVKIHLLESSKLNLYGFYCSSNSLVISFSYNCWLYLS